MDHARCPRRHAPRRGAAVAVAVAVAVALWGCTSEPPQIAQTPDLEAADPDPEPVGFPPLGTDADALDETVVTLRTEAGDRRVDAKVAATDEDRQRGLMGVAELPDGVGMLFLFDEDRTGGFWMRNTLVPLDIAYLDADGTIGTILAMDPCQAQTAGDCPVYTPPTPYRAALEVPQGWFASVGVEEGHRVTWQDPTASSVRS